MTPEEAWTCAVAQMDHWNRRDSSKMPVGGNARISGVHLFDKTLELARFLAEPTPTLTEVAGGGPSPERLPRELNDNQGEA